MTYGTLEWHKERHDYWHKEYSKANKRASAAIAEAKKSKERELTAIRLMLKFKAELDSIRKYLPRFPLFNERKSL